MPKPPLLLGFWLVFLLIAHGQDDRALPNDWEATNKLQPEGLQLQMTLPKDHFQQGEVISATLTFSNTSPVFYDIWTGEYDRSGRIPDIGIIAQDASGKRLPDPMAWFYLCGMGGRGSTKTLGTWSITLPANQWIRFDQPGIYTLFATSRRVRTFVAGAPGGTELVSLVSDPIRITIEPLTPEFEKQVIAETKRKLPLSEGSLPEETIAPLRYLGTPAARKELVALLNAPRLSGEIRMGLMALAKPDEAAPEILDGVRQGKLLLTYDIIWLYSSLKCQPLLAQQKVDPFSAELSRNSSAAGKEAEAEIMAAAIQASGGSGPAYFDLLLLQLGRDPQNLKARATLVEHQLDLSKAQAGLLLGDGNKIAGEEFVPLARKMAAEPNWNVSALRTLAEWKPAEAQALLVQNTWSITSNDRTSGATEATMGRLHLPVTPLSELDSILVRRLHVGGNLGVTAYYIQQFGTPKILPAAIECYEQRGGKGNLITQKFFLWYWLRCDPKGGTEALAQALEERSVSHNYKFLLKDVLLERWTPEALPLLLRSLDDPDADVVTSAILVLEAHAGTDNVDRCLSALKRVSLLPPGTERSAASGVIHSVAKRLLESRNWSYTLEQTAMVKDLATEQDDHAASSQVSPQYR